MRGMETLRRFFALAERGTTVGTEVRAGTTTFLTMSYILFVNPDILAAAGMPAEDVAIATALASAVATLIMGVFANFPFALAPGMGLNAFFTYTVVLQMGIPWRTALAVILVEGIIFMALAFGGVRTLVLNAIPVSIKRATTVGIGLFLALIGLQKAGIVVGNPATLITLGDLGEERVLLSLLGLLIMTALMARRVKGAILIGIVTIATLAWWSGAASAPDSFLSWPRLPRETFLALDFGSIPLDTFLVVMLSFLFVDFFDTAGTLVGVGTRAGFVDDEGKLPRADRAFFADACGTTAGALLGTSTVTSYIESGAGVEEGGRTGLTAVVVAGLFLLALFFTPLLASIPAFVTAPALIVVGALMMSSARDLPWERLDESLPAFLCITLMPFTYNIANGISAAIVSHVGIKLMLGRWRQVHPVLALLSVLLCAYYLTLKGH